MNELLHSTGGGPTNPGLDGTGFVVGFRRWVTSAAAIYGKRYICDSCPEVALRTWNGVNYLKAINGGDGAVVADATAIGSWERFRIVSFREGFSPWVALQTTSGRWVTVVNGGDGAVTSGTNYVNTDETFVLGTANGGITFGTRKTPRRYVVAENAGGGAVNANRASAGIWGSFFALSL